MKRVILAFIVFLLCSGYVFAIDRERVKVYNSSYAKNISGEIKYVDIVIDYSGSMSAWIEETKRAVMTITSKLPNNIQIGVRTFGETPTETKHRTIKQVSPNKIVVNVKTTKSGSNCSATTQALPIAQNSSETIVSSLNKIKLGGSTPITLGLSRAVSSDFSGIGTHHMKKIILITDGGENCGGNPCQFIRNLVRTRKDFVVDVIYTGLNNSTLRCLSDATNGKFYNIKDVSSFENVMMDSITNQQSAPTNSSTPNSSQYGYVYVE